VSAQQRTDMHDMLVALEQTINAKGTSCSWASSGEVRAFMEDRWQIIESVAWVTARLRDAARAQRARRVRLTAPARGGGQRTVGYAWELITQPAPAPAPPSDRERRRRELGLGVGAYLAQEDPLRRK
jgi:hypothetical protein